MNFPQGRDGKGGKPDVSHRPALPDHPEQMAVDIEDEEADPVVDTGPGIADGHGDPNTPPPEPVPPLLPDPQPNDPKPAPAPMEDGLPPPVPVKLPGQPHAPERV